MLEISQEKHVKIHPLKGALFENFVVAELLKQRFNQGKTNNLYYFRDNVGNEVDVILDEGLYRVPIEIKMGQTINRSFFKGLEYYQKIDNTSQNKGKLIYGGKENSSFSDKEVISFREIKE